MEQENTLSLGQLQLAKSQMDKAAASTCPHCGYCPHCGRGGWRIYPYMQPYVAPYVTWTCPPNAVGTYTPMLSAN